MRLLLITNDYPPKPGGIQMYLKNLVDAYPDDILVFGPADSTVEASERGVVRGDRPYMLPRRDTTEEVLGVARDFSPDAVLFGAPHPLPRMGPTLKASLGIPFGILHHGAEVTVPAAIPGVRQAVGRMSAAADVRFAVSRFTAGRVRRMSGRETVYLGAGVEIDTFTPGEPRPFNTPPVIGCVSRFVPRKGQHRLLEAVSRLGRDVRVLLVGRGRFEGRLRSQAKRTGLDVEFAVDVPWGDLPGLYRRMDVFAMPTSSRWGGLEVEGLGLVYLEAAASGLPVLAGDSGGSPETVLPGRTGFVVASVDALVEGLGMLLDDPDRAREMGQAGRRFVETEFTWGRVVERLQNGFAPHLG